MQQNKLVPVLIIIIILCLGIIGYLLMPSPKTKKFDGFTDTSDQPAETTPTDIQTPVPPATTQPTPAQAQNDNLTRESYQNQSGVVTATTLKTNGEVVATVDLISRNPAYSDENLDVPMFINNQSVLKRFLIDTHTQFSGCGTDGSLTRPTGETVTTPAAFSALTNQLRAHYQGSNAPFEGNPMFDFNIQNGVVTKITASCI